jgi:hypothetical protein
MIADSRGVSWGRRRKRNLAVVGRGCSRSALVAEETLESPRGGRARRVIGVQDVFRARTGNDPLLHLIFMVVGRGQRGCVGPATIAIQKTKTRQGFSTLRPAFLVMRKVRMFYQGGETVLQSQRKRRALVGRRIVYSLLLVKGSTASGFSASSNSAKTSVGAEL